MKKLVVLAAVAIMAACSQAASFRWATSGVTDGTNPISGTATLYALVGSDWKVVDTQTMTSGAVAAADALFTDAAFVTGTIYQFKYELTNAEGTFASATKSSKAQATSTPTINFGAGGTWTPASTPTPGPGGDVPEPTSGLLLLAGAGLLGLRRKNA